jgi:hypothetical protein
VNDEQSNWHTLLRSAEYCHNSSKNSSTGESPFFALLGYNPELRLDLNLEDEVHPGGVPAVHARLQKLEDAREKMREHWRYAVDRQVERYNRKHKPIQFKRGQLVMLSTRNLRFDATKTKLAPRFIGPFRVLERVGKQAYRLALPQQYSLLHNVFPVSLLEPWHSNKGSDPLPMPPLAEEEDEWEVEAILDKATIDREAYYLVKWKDWPPEYNSYQPEEDLQNAPLAIAAFKGKQKRTTTRTQGVKRKNT